MLNETSVDYLYEPETFKLSNGDTYTPDFIVFEDIVIEVKGWADEKSKTRARLFMQKYPDYKYIVVGNELPSDRHIEWEEKEKLLKAISP